MPNHITTLVQSSEHTLNSLLNKDNEVDFNLIIPSPDNLETGGCSGKHAPGVICWFEWNIENWGTKWNAYDTVITNGQIKFETAWRHPFEVIVKLSEDYPDDEILVAWANEDLGYDQGLYRIKNGVITDAASIDTSASALALEFASYVKNGMGYEEAFGEDEQELDEFDKDVDDFKARLKFFDPDGKLSDIDEILTIENYPKASPESIGSRSR